MADLKTNYKDDVLDTSKNEKRKFRMIQNDDGTVSFDDATEYTQQGDAFGAADINATNAKINEQTQSLTQIKTYVGKDGKLHFVDSTGADTVIPFNSGYKEVAIVFADYQRVVACILIKPDKSVHYGWGSLQGDYMDLHASGNGNCSIIAKKAGKYLVFDTQATVPKTSTTQVDASANKTIVMSTATTQFSINVAVAL